MAHPPGNDDRKPLDRREFLKAGSLGVTALADRAAAGGGGRPPKSVAIDLPC